MIKVRFELNYVGCDEIVEFDDDTTEEEISEAYNEWLQEQGAGWDYYEDEQKKGERKMLNVVIKDITFDESYYLKLSKEQVRLLEWLINENILVDVRVEKFEGYEFKEI